MDKKRQLSDQFATFSKRQKVNKKSPKYRLDNQPNAPSSNSFNPNSRSKVLIARNKKGTGRNYTVSVALPGSIIENAQSAELKTYLAGQIARAFAVFNVDEIVIYNESNKPMSAASEDSGRSDPNIFLARILQYLECPQYLRKNFFPVHRDLKFAGLLNPLDCPHHVRIDEYTPYREGVVLPKTTKLPSTSALTTHVSLVNCGLRKEVSIDKKLKPGVRVTVELTEPIEQYQSGKAKFTGVVVSPAKPREESGLYWGYQVRLAEGINKVFEECPYEGGYDLTVGTSERGKLMEEAKESIPEFRHLLIVFGGLRGIEASVDADETLKISSEDAGDLFNLWINTCPDQGSRTIRTEEAVLITMAKFQEIISVKGKK